MERIKLLKGGITKLAVDAIVNAANSGLRGGGGVDGAIHRAGGPSILEECRRIVARKGNCPTGEAVITSGGDLPASWVIHTVGPVWNAAQKDEMKRLLSSCYRNSLRLASDHSLRTIAFPNISTGVYGYPKALAAGVAIDAVRNYLERDNSIETVTFVCFDDENYQLYAENLGK